jgi:hypothetical protein
MWSQQMPTGWGAVTADAGWPAVTTKPTATGLPMRRHAHHGKRAGEGVERGPPNQRKGRPGAPMF